MYRAKSASLDGRETVGTKAYMAVAVRYGVDMVGLARALDTFPDIAEYH